MVDQTNSQYEIRNINCSEGVEWSGNKVINKIGQVVMECTLKEIDNKTYLLLLLLVDLA